MSNEILKFEDLKGQTLYLAEKNSNEDKITFITDDGEVFDLFHSQNCCEQVYIESIVGDLNDLIGSEILMAEEVYHSNETPDGCPPLEANDSYTWSFYKLATLKGYVDIRFYGSSNGYYSESASFVKNMDLSQEYEGFIKNIKLNELLEEKLPHEKSNIKSQKI